MAYALRIFTIIVVVFAIYCYYVEQYIDPRKSDSRGRRGLARVERNAKRTLSSGFWAWFYNKPSVALFYGFLGGPIAVSVGAQAGLGYMFLFLVGWGIDLYMDLRMAECVRSYLEQSRFDAQRKADRETKELMNSFKK